MPWTNGRGGAFPSPDDGEGRGAERPGRIGIDSGSPAKCCRTREPSCFARCRRGRELREGGSAVGPEEATLVERAKGGDVGAYEELVRGHQAVAFRTAFTITGDAAEAEDAAQEAFVKVYRTLDRFRSGAPFRPWLLTVVANEARNRRRAAGRRVGLTLRAAEHAQQTAPPSPETAVVAEERRAELLGAVEGLREEDREVISLRYFLELTEAEAAAVMGCARGTVKSRLSRAVGRLREKMMEAQDATG